MSEKGSASHTGQLLAFYYLNLLDLLGIVWDFDQPQAGTRIWNLKR
jgi:hypothetical protein